MRILLAIRRRQRSEVLRALALEVSTVHVLVADDYEPWRRFIRSTLQRQSEFEIVGEVSDGLEAVQKAQQLQPDLILLDIGLPRLNGIEAARRIRELSPESTILFVSENRSPDLAGAALRTGALGYVVKSDAASELLPAVRAVLQGKQFVSAGLAGHGLTAPKDEQPRELHRDNVVEVIPPQSVETPGHHEARFYSTGQWFLDDVTQFIGAALKAGNAAIVAATESHRDGLLPKLWASGVDIDAALEQGRCILLDAADGLSTFMVNGLPDPVRYMKLFGNLILTASKAVKVERPALLLTENVCSSCGLKVTQKRRFRSRNSATNSRRPITWISCAPIQWAAFKAEWTVTSIKEFVRSIRPSIPGERNYQAGFFLSVNLDK